MSYWMFWLALSLSVLVHELGHASAMKFTKVPIQSIRWGFGQIIFRCGVFEMRLVPIFGFCQAGLQNWTGFENKGVFIGVSGVVAQWVILLLLKFTGAARIFPTFSGWWFLFALLGLWQLVPIGKTDGSQIRLLIRQRKIK